MNYRELLFDAEILQIGAATAAGTGDTLTFTEVDMLGYDSVMGILELGAVTATAVGTFRAKNSGTTATYGAGTVDCISSDATAANIISAVCGTGDSNKSLVLDFHRLSKRFVRFELVRATANIAVLAVVAIRYNARQKPTAQATANIPAGGATAASNATVSAA